MRPPRSRSSGPTPSHPPAARAAPRKALPGKGGVSVSAASALLTPMPRVPTRLVPGSPADLRRREEERARRLAIARHAEAAPFEVLVPPQPRAAAVLVPTQDSIDHMIHNYRNVLVDEARPAQHDAAPPREANRVTPARASPAVTDTSPATVSGASTAPEGPDDVVSLVVEGVFRALGVGRHKAAPMSSNAVQQLMITASKPVASQDTFSMAHSVFLQLMMAARDAVLFAAKLDLAVEDAMAESDESSAAPSSSWGSELAQVTEGTVAHDFARALRCHMWRSRARHENAEGHDEEATRTRARLVISPLQFDKGPHGSLLSSSHAWVFVTQAAAEMGYPRCAELACSTSTPPPVASATPLSSEEHAANRQWFCGALELLMFLLWVAELYSFAEIVVGLTVEEASRGDKDDASAESRTRSVPFPKADSTHVSWSAVHQHHSTTLRGKLAAAIDGLTRREYENDRPPETALRLTEQLQHGVVQRACALQLEAVEAQLCTYASLCSKLGNHVPVDALQSLDRDATKSAIRTFDLMTAAGERVARLRSALRNVGELVATAIMSSADPNPTQNIVDEDNDVSASDVSAALEDLCRSLADTVRVNLGAMQRKKATKGLEQAWTSHSRLGLSKADIDSARRNAAQLQHDWYGDYSFPSTLQGALLDIVSVADDGAFVTDPEPGLMLPVARPRMTDDALTTITEPSPVTKAIYPWYSLTSQWNGYRSTTSKDDNTVACWTAVGEVAQNQSTTFGMLLGTRHGEEPEPSTTPDFQSRRQDIATRYCLRVPQTAVDRFAKLARRSVDATTVPSARRAADEDAPLDEDPLRATTEEDAKVNPFHI